MANTKVPVELSSTPSIVDNGNATAITIDSSENVGIGTSSPAVPLDINIGTNNNGLYIRSTDRYSNIGLTDNTGSIKVGSDNGAMFFEVGGDSSFASLSEAMRIDASGLVGIGNTVAATLHAVSTVSNLVVGTGSGNNGIGVYSGSSNLGAITFADGTSGNATYRGGITYNHSTDHLELNGNGGTAHVIVHASGVTSIPNGVELGSGVDATAANTLDDYEEGTFTPTFSNSNSTAVGKYTKIGNKVTVRYHVVSTGGLPSSGGQVQIGNLPFTSANDGLHGAGAIYIGPSNVSSATGGGGTIVTIMEGNATVLRLVNVDTGTFGYTLWGELEVSSNNVVTAIGTFTYFV